MMKNVYLWLGIAILFEVIGATFMKYTDGFSNWGPTLIVILSYAIALFFYIFLTKDHELGIINALWSGGGTVIIAVAGILLFQESTSLIKLLAISLIVIGIIGLNTKSRYMKKGEELS
ncbi:QacE family quaternary ammonium compound efflux SMR transporter [Bacillus hwajinpoensis]|uniref:QacE family quaternary ammonium compound efflux SMR transporter n=2 Tax=Guptibacillus hwajinpoensis TaxID=208199 RepID=A0A845F174_9BACL|nr:QacE family quaternary ammonium compound efflux SMR transporter [Pseudalkalibacillus hwajinpoensis]